MTREVKISIIIANYNNGHFFKDCYESLLAQTAKTWEAILIDDCSTDNSVEIITRLIKDDNRFRFYKNEKNLGYQSTLVKGIELSNTQIFGRLDPDDALMPDALQLSLDTHMKNPNVGLVYSNLIICDNQLKPISVQKGKQISSENFFVGEISHFATFKKDIYAKTSGISINNKRAEDKDIYLKMCEVAPAFYIDADLYKYRIHGGGASTNQNIDKAYFWYWVALIKASERRDINIENLFLQEFVRRYQYNILQNKLSKIKKSRLLRLFNKLGLFKAYKDL
ncbi:glycosyltransferase family 2 protein [Chryseobacterium oryzae]|uniref:Glycosyltransferase family 2 protein n=1 Tax=Chryseobacterium oryzae TaxID=2929799 RepID=A0ABY4BJB8_9FLAO|nr:glycosyltransferase family 2 protein [Chryseobacterium oryzae]UOE38006.1 glycosyltransferase family 2 protein [Chryseobacterium oryzae]